MSDLQPTSPPAPICITGMHRSGTSMVTRMLHECGVYLGPEENLLSPSDENLDGYWENSQIVALNDAILVSLGGAWDAPPKQANSVALLEQYGDRARALLAELQTRPVCGWKDPRVCLTFPFWRGVCPDLRLVVCLRSPVEVARSLNRRKDTVGYDQGLTLWGNYYEQLLRDAGDADRIIITHYDAFFYNAADELKRLASFLSLPSEAADAASRIVSDRLRHNASTRQLIESAKLPAELAALYHRMCDATGPVYAAMQADDAYQQRLAAQLPPALQDELISAERRISYLSSELRETRRQLNEVAAIAHEQNGEIHRLQLAAAARDGELEILRPRLAQREQQIADLRASSLYRIYSSVLKPLVRLVSGKKYDPEAL